MGWTDEESLFHSLQQQVFNEASTPAVGSIKPSTL